MFYLINKIMKTTKISIIIGSLFIFITACTSKEDPAVTPETPETPVLKPQVDPVIANTTGFFLDNWSPKNFTSPVSFTESAAPTSTSSTVTIDYANVITKIPNTIYGNNSNLWSGKMVTDSKLMTDI